MPCTYPRCPMIPSHSLSKTNLLKMHRFSITVITISILLFTKTHSTLQNKPNGHLSRLASQFLGPQNAARTGLRMPPLKWDIKLQRYATWYANQRRYDCALVHSNGPYGENIFWGSGNGWNPVQAAEAWVNEKQWYNYWSNSCSENEECGHYTQIVWRNTKRIGCAKVICFGGKGVFMTCNYDPPGNYIGERPY